MAEHEAKAVALASAELIRSLIETLRRTRSVNAKTLRVMIEVTRDRMRAAQSPGPDAANFVDALFEGDPVMGKPK